MSYDNRVPNWRQHILRASFLLSAISLAPDHWTLVFSPAEQVDAMTGVAISFYAAFSLLCLFGVRFPLKFIPLLLIQLIYKCAWLMSTYLPAQVSAVPNESLESWFWVMAPGIVIDLFVIPWGYVYREYLRNFFRLNVNQ